MESGIWQIECLSCQSCAIQGPSQSLPRLMESTIRVRMMWKHNLESVGMAQDGLLRLKEAKRILDLVGIKVQLTSDRAQRWERNLWSAMGRNTREARMLLPNSVIQWIIDMVKKSWVTRHQFCFVELIVMIGSSFLVHRENLTRYGSPTASVRHVAALTTLA